MQTQINDFVGTTPAAGTADTTATDKIMADAVDNLVANTTPAASSPSEVAAVEVSPAAPASEPTPAPAAPVADAQNAPQNDSVAIAHKKIINPIDSAPKPDLNALLAAEEAKAAIPTAEAVISGDVTAGTPTPPPSATAEPAPSSTQTTGNPATQEGFDPNNIAL